MAAEYDEHNVEFLISAVQRVLQERNYSQKYLRDMGFCFKGVARFCKENHIVSYTPDTGRLYLTQRYGAEIYNSRNKVTQAKRSINILDEYLITGHIGLRAKKCDCVTQTFSRDIEGYLSDLRNSFKSDGTLQRHGSILRQFVSHLAQCGIDHVKDIGVDDICEYVKLVLSRHCRHHALDSINIIKRFMSYLREQGRTFIDISEIFVPVHKTPIERHLPSVLNVDEVNNILGSVDRESPVGKRDYAILMLAAKLGLRTSDIRNLKPENIDWDNRTLNIIQVKTGRALSLPLPKDVGWALIDYIQNVRPRCDCREIFVRAVAPYVPLSCYSRIVEKYMKRAGVEFDRLRHHGMHVFRSTAATRMLEQGISLPEIQNTLGHANSDSAKSYTSVSKNQLMGCSLEVPAYDA